MKRQSPTLVILTLIVIPAVVAVAATLIVLNVFGEGRERLERVVMLPTESSTSQPAGPGTNPQEAPDPVDEDGVPQNPGEIGALPEDEEEVPTIVPGCENPTHVVEVGQTLGRLAEEYDISIEEITQINQAADPNFDPDFLSVGQIIIIPACGIPTATPTATATPTGEPTLLPTATEGPVGDVDIVISRVINAGDITREAVEIVNRGTPVDMGGWRLSGGRTIQYEFPSFRLFSDGAVTVYTGVGENSPIELYWGRSAAVWEDGAEVQLLNAQGDVVDEYEVGAEE